jgi:hypothetical protein
MTETAGAETEGTRTRGSIARRMLVAAAIWSAFVVLVAGWSLQAFYRSETDHQLDLVLDDTLLTLAAAANSEQGLIKVEDTKLPRDERFSRALSGRYWAFVDLDGQNKVVGFRKSDSLFDEEPALAEDVRAGAVKVPGTTLFLDMAGPDAKQVRAGIRAITFTD